MSVVALDIPKIPLALWLPFPPSLNGLWRVVNNRPILSKPYRAWRMQAGLHLNTQYRRPIKGRFVLNILADRPDRRERDLDNLPKAVLDLLKAHQVIEDDHLTERFTCSWSTRMPGKDAKVWLTVEEAG